MLTKHTKPSAWQIRMAESFIRKVPMLSNVMYVQRKDNKSRLQNGWRQKVRVAKSTGEVID